MRTRQLPMMPVMIALCAACGPGFAGEAEQPPVKPPVPSVTDELARAQETPGTSANQQAVQADALFVAAQAQANQNNWIEAKALVQKAIGLNPEHAGAQKLREQVLAVLGERRPSVAVTGQSAQEQASVAQQELAVRVAALKAAGEKKMSAGDYLGAELEFDRAEVAIRASSYNFDWEKLPAQVAGLRREARARAEMTRLKARQEAIRTAKVQAQLIEAANDDALRKNVDELLRRAQAAYARKDFRRAEVDAWNAYESDRRREDARQLFLDARRESHNLFDKDTAQFRLETMTRVHEEIHKSLIPQNEILLFPEDWSRRALRSAAKLGDDSQVDTWRKAINDRLEQRLSVPFVETPFEEVITYLRRVSGLNIIIDPKVTVNSPPAVTLQAKDMQLRHVLRWVLDLTKLQMAIQDQAIYITTEIQAGSVTIAMYDVTDLTMVIKDFPGRDIGFAGFGGGGGGGGAPDPAAATAPTAADLQGFIQKEIAPGTWDPAKGTAVEIRASSTLFVSHNPEVQKQVQKLLDEMRSRRSLQVNMEIRQIAVRKGYFEEIGVDWNNNPVGLLGSSTSNGYTRLNDTISYNGTLANNMPSNSNGYSAINPSSGNRGLTLESSLRPFNFYNVDQVNWILTASEEEVDINVLQAPSVTCFNNQRANAQFLQQFSYIQSYDVVGGNFDPKIAVLNFGTTIDLRPVVSADRKFVTVDMQPTINELNGNFLETLIAPRIINAGDQSAVLGNRPYQLELPNVSTNRLRTTARLPNRGSVMLGGYNNSSTQRTHSGIPFLSHIPFLGRLFSRNGVYDQHSQTYFLITARIVDVAEQETRQ